MPSAHVLHAREVPGPPAHPRRGGSALVCVAALLVGLFASVLIGPTLAAAAPPNPSDAAIQKAQQQRVADVAALGRLNAQIAAITGDVARAQATSDAALAKYQATSLALQQAVRDTAAQSAALDQARKDAERSRLAAVAQIKASYLRGPQTSISALAAASDPNALLSVADVQRYVSARQRATFTATTTAQIGQSNVEAAARAAQVEQQRLTDLAQTERDDALQSLRRLQDRQAQANTQRVGLEKQAAITYGRLNGLKTQRAAYLAWAAEQKRLAAAEAARQAEIRRQAEAARQAELARQAEVARQRQQGQAGDAATTVAPVAAPVLAPALAPVAPLPAGGTWGRPMRPGTYTITSCYCARWGTFHYGVDLGAPLGTPIYAVGPGTVVAAGAAQGFGNWVVIDHGEGSLSIYGHMKTFVVSAGQRVTVGQLIAFVGAEGEATGPHLHFEVRLGGIFSSGSDPDIWLARRGVYL